MGADAKVAGDLTKCSCQRRHFPFYRQLAYQPESTKTIQLAGFGAKQVPFRFKGDRRTVRVAPTFHSVQRI